MLQINQIVTISVLFQVAKMLDGYVTDWEVRADQ